MVQRKNHKSTRFPNIIITYLLLINLTTAQIIQIHHINVGQGDACFIKINTKDTTINFLIDAGNQNHGNNTIITYLKTLGITKLDFTIASHYHADHIGGLDEVINQLNPSLCYDRGSSYETIQFQQYNTSAKERRRTLNPKDTIINLNTNNTKIRLTCIASNATIWNHKTTTSDENSLSIALLLELSNQTHNFKFLTAGDIYAEQESLITISILSNNTNPKTNIIKISHHGSNKSTPNFILQKLKPDAVIITVGNSNPYNHPHPETLQKLQNSPSIKYIYQTETGARTTTKSIISEHIIINIYDTTFTITTTKKPSKIDTFHLNQNKPLYIQKQQKQTKMNLNMSTVNSFTYINISTPNETIQKIQIYNILGQLLYEQNTTAPETYKIKIPNTATGTYFIIVKTNKNIYKDKLIIIK